VYNYSIVYKRVENIYKKDNIFAFFSWKYLHIVKKNRKFAPKMVFALSWNTPKSASRAYICRGKSAVEHVISRYKKVTQTNGNAYDEIFTLLGFGCLVDGSKLGGRADGVYPVFDEF